MSYRPASHTRWLDAGRGRPSPHPRHIREEPCRTELDVVLRVTLAPTVVSPPPVSHSGVAHRLAAGTPVTVGSCRLPCEQREVHPRIGGRRPPAGHHMRATHGHSLDCEAPAGHSGRRRSRWPLLTIHPSARSTLGVWQLASPVAAAVTLPAGIAALRPGWRSASLPGPPWPLQARERGSHACAGPHRITRQAGFPSSARQLPHVSKEARHLCHARISQQRSPWFK